MRVEVLTSIDDRVGRLRLNRPQAIHALNLAMCRAMLDALDSWEADAQVAAILIDHAEGRGFCAGGDIRMAASDEAVARDFFRAEYRLNHRLFTCAKPTVAFMDGITMGGGVGLALPCRYRVATENTRFAMPEAAIGLFPDVGGGWYLSRLPGRAGQFLALTGHRLDGAECLALGLATHYLPSPALDGVKQAIARDPEQADALLTGAATEPPEAAILAQLPEIDRLFASDRLEDVLSATMGSTWAEALKGKCPTTMKVALRQLAEAAVLPGFAEEMTREYAISLRMAARQDFREGVRALLIDKDNAPNWDPAEPAAVTAAMIDAIFAPLPQHEAWTPA